MLFRWEEERYDRVEEMNARALRRGVGITGFVALLFLFLASIPGTLVCCAQTPPETPKVLTLREAIALALRNQPAIEAQQGQVLAGEAKAGQARGGYYPHISLGSAYARIGPVGSRTGATTSLAGLPPGSSIPTGTETTARSYEQYSATANLSQLLFDFGKTGAQVKAQTLSAEAARRDLENIREQVVFAVKQAYYSLLSAQENRTVALEAVDQFKRHVEYARALVETGLKSRSEVTKAEVDLSSAEVNLIKAENGERLARTTLNNAMGLPHGPPYRAEEEPSSAWTEPSFEAALQLALSRRPDLVALQKQKESARESIRAAQRSHFPTLNGTASAVYVGTGFPLDSGWTAGLNMVFPLFTGFVTSHQVAEAQANYMVAGANEKSLKQTIVLDLEQGFLSLHEAAERMRSTEISVRQARENLELATERYAAGLAIGVEVTDAVVAYANARLSHIGARYDHRVAQARIDKAMGGRTE